MFTPYASISVDSVNLSRPNGFCEHQLTQSSSPRVFANAVAMGVSWSDGGLAGRALALHAALPACGIDPTTVIFVNLLQHRDDRWELNLELLPQLVQVAAPGATVVALGQRVHRAFGRVHLDHFHLVHPAARGRIRARACYQAHVAAVPNGSAPAPPNEPGVHQCQEVLHAWTQHTQHDPERPGVPRRE
jgi:hypothetical protein